MEQSFRRSFEGVRVQEGPQAATVAKEHGAETAADLVMQGAPADVRPNGAAPSTRQRLMRRALTGVQAPGSAPLQMACAGGCECTKCSTGRKNLFKSIGLQKKTYEAAPADGKADKGPPMVDAEEVRRRLGSGTPLSPIIAQRFSAAYGRDLSGVQVHTDSRLATQLGARAFTVGQDVAFAPGEYRPGTGEGDRLIAHELAHVVQQAGMTGAVQGAGLSEASYEAEADRAADTALAGGRVSGFSTVGHGAVQKEEKKGVLDRAMEFGSDLVGSAVDTARSGVLAGIRLASPGLADFLEDPLGYLEKQLLPSIQAWVEDLFGVDLGDLASDAQKTFTELASTVSGVIEGDEKACLPFAGALKNVASLYDRLRNNAAVEKLSSVMATLRSSFDKVAKLVREPAFDMLRKEASRVWEDFTKISYAVGWWIEAVNKRVTGAADLISSALGLADGPGLMDFLRGKAQQIWARVQKTLAPVAKPLEVLAGALRAAQPATWAYAIFKHGPSVIEGAKWLWTHKNDPSIVTTAREQGHETLASILTTVKGMGGALRSAAQEATGAFVSGATAAAGLVEMATGLPILSAAKGVAGRLAGTLQTLAPLIEAGLSQAGAWTSGVADDMATAIAPIQSVLRKLGGVLLNPASIPGLLAGRAWQKLPDCYKEPVLDLILDTLVRMLEASPDPPQFGPLWTLFKPGVLGYVRQLQKMSSAIKVEASNKIASFMSGDSPSFLQGFAKGMLEGIWDSTGGTLVDIVELGHMLLEFAEGAVSRAVSAIMGTPAKPAEAKPAPIPSPAAQSSIRLDASGVTEREITREELDQYRPREEPEGGKSHAPPPVDAAQLEAETNKLKEELAPSAATVLKNADGALRDYFKSGSAMTYEELTTKLGEAWGMAQNLISAQGAKLAREAMAVLLGKDGDLVVGQKVGWLAGTIVSEVVISILTAGTGTAAKQAVNAAKVASTAAKPARWTARAFETIVSTSRRAGQFLMDAAKGLEKLAAKVKGSLHRVVEAIQNAGRSFAAFVERLLGRARTPHVPDMPHASRAHSVPHEVHAPAIREPHAAPKQPHGKAGTRAEREASVKESGHIESNELSQGQIDNELQHITDSPHIIHGDPPNRRAKIGEHTWEEQPGGGWCRHSISVVCGKLDEGNPPRLADGTVDKQSLQKARDERFPPWTRDLKTEEGRAFKRLTEGSTSEHAEIEAMAIIVAARDPSNKIKLKDLVRSSDVAADFEYISIRGKKYNINTYDVKSEYIGRYNREGMTRETLETHVTDRLEEFKNELLETEDRLESEIRYVVADLSYLSKSERAAYEKAIAEFKKKEPELGSRIIVVSYYSPGTWKP